tara:strand:- start:49832 stop:51190 length:1359 start_codon:yes stop_codon:yes gene_type:complete
MKNNVGIILKDIFRRIRKRDFSGNTGIVIKNSALQFSTNIIAKGGSLLFTIILARMLMPELFGLYSLALSTILIFSTFSELGVGETLIRFISKEFGKNKKKFKSKSYVIYLGKLKLFLVFTSMLILIVSAKFISENYYQKPLFLALMAGSLYILFIGLTGFLKSILIASNYFKGIFYQEIIFQISRLIIVPLLVLLSLRQVLLNETIIFFIILGLSASYFISSIFLLILSKNKFKYLTEKEEKISPLEKNKVNKFILPASTTVFATIFFGSIDMIMLGRFVLPEYIGYYRAALGLVAAIAPLITFSIVLLPVFSRLKNQQLERGFKKSILVTLLFSLVFAFSVFLLSPFIINFVYGSEYGLAINILRFFSLLLISAPILLIYSSYFIAKGKPKIVLRILIYSVIINILLNFLVILFLNDYGNLAIVYGVTGATIISNWFYMFSLMIKKKRGY